MRILVFITIMGAVGLAVLLLLPDIRQQEVKAPSALFPVEQVNPTVRDVTPDHALPGPEIITPQITRLPSLALPVAPKRTPVTKAWHNVLVKTAGEFSIGDSVRQIGGVKALRLDETCTTQDGNVWPCGRFARTAMRGLIRNRAIKCDTMTKGITTVKCTVGNRDIGQWLVQQGWARDAGGGYEAAMQLAKAKKRGMWRKRLP